MQENKAEGRVWAVVHSLSGKKYIGCIDSDTMLAVSDVEVVLRKFDEGKALRMTGAFELTTAMMPAPDPATQQMGMKHIVQPMPVDACQEGATIHVLAGAINFFDDMAEEDMATHHGLIERLEEQLKMQRAKRSGLVLAGADQMPRGHGRS